MVKDINKKDSLYAWMLSLPAITGLTLFILLPFVIALILSFSNYRFNSPLPLKWIGFTNYKNIFTESNFLKALTNNLIFTSIVVPVQTALALILAIAVNQKLKGTIIFRTIFFMPVIYPMALVAIVWSLIFAPGEQGLLNYLLNHLPFSNGNHSTDFLNSTFFAFPAIMLMSVWQGVGFQMIILLAALQGIPQNLYEAAQIDNANKWNQFIHITLPQLRNSLIFVAIMTSILAFRLFDQVWILTQGGPKNTTTTILYEAFLATRERNQIGYGSAITIMFFIIVTIITLLQHVILKQRREIK